MKAVLLFAFLYGAAAFADETAPLVTPHALPRGGKVSRSFGGDGKKHKPPGAFVRGHCTLLDSPLNPISGPCISVPLELKNARGISMGIVRTSPQGDFDFSVEESGPFTLAPSSSYYLVVSPPAKLHRGESHVALEIKGKN